MMIYETYKDDLRYSKRRNVTLLPCLSIPRSAKSAYGFVGAYEDQTPIPESLRLTMGSQLYLFAPFQEAVEYVDEAVIYAGIPNPGYGHFLLDAMARLWYAKDHPEIPIIWDATALPALAAPIFDLVGIRNRHLFLDRPMRFREVIFPVPGVAIGDYFLKGHADFLGAFNGGDPIPGKKLYLSRRNMKSGIVVAEEVIEDLVRSHGFQVYYPEQHTIAEQLKEISTSSIVLGVEGSALHTVVLLKAPIQTRFYALARHRRGGGVFEHIRLQKGIQYTTLNLLREKNRLSNKSEVDVDIDLLGRVLFETKGLDEESPLIKYAERPKAPETNYLDVIEKFSLKLSDAELAAYKVLKLLMKRGESEIISEIAPIFQPIRVNKRSGKIVDSFPSFTEWRTFVDESLAQSGAMKPKAFIDVYSELLYGKRFGSMLEIGIHQGNSLCFFRKLLGGTTKIYAVDIKKECATLVDKGADKIFIGSQVDEEFILDICHRHGPFDLVIDDGSHKNAHMLKSLEMIFPHLKPGGLYVVEDMHTSYWDSYGGKLRGVGTFMEVTKERLDKLFLRYMAPRYRNDGRHMLNPNDLPAEDAISALVDSIRVYRAGIAVFKKIA